MAIPPGTTEINERAFYEDGLTEIFILDSVTTIGVDAFAKNQLSSVVISNSVTTIGRDAFANNQLSSVVIPDSVTKIGHHAFRGNRVTSITIPDHLYIDGVAFDPGVPESYFALSGGVYALQDGKWTLNGAKIAYSELIPGDGIYISTIDGKWIGKPRARQILKPGWHDIEVKYDNSRVHSKGAVTFEQRYLFEDGKYSITGKPEGDQIIFTIKREN